MPGPFLTLSSVLASFLGSITISSSCRSALATIATGPASGCLNPGGLIALAATVGSNSSTPIVSPVSTWVQGLCGQPACDNSTLSPLVSAITSGCQSELRDIGLSSGDIGTLDSSVARFYPAGREAICLRDTNRGNALCVASLLGDVQNSTGQPLTVASLPSAVVTVVGNSTLGRQVICSQCAQGAYNIIRSPVPNSTVDSVDRYFNATCGSDFIRAGEPANIVVATGTLATPKPSSSSPGAAIALRAPISITGISAGSLGAGLGIFILGFAWTLVA
ncbi:uncharacterized protein EI90DRAFT_3128822 [Cantharellus anzutake]|uniref:uncharacterized protein n=1 Tax=Cantharellus anzutake TaxID=1750568 RepID=UPI001904504D|nr:uncharacterized protein EI90DRAFT_3128822 [Cantharellus anzutake]KAF8325459.1 hypothetical protein EI90DRAFT_3128822 [Cantharellus anzutake]